jgi:hypothetical protein
MEPPDIPLPNDVHELMQLSKELVDLIYWVPTATEGSEGARIPMDKLAYWSPWSKTRTKRSHLESTADNGKSDGEGVAAKRVHSEGSTSRGAYGFPWPEGADLETRVEMGSALLSGHGAYDIQGLFIL